MVVPVRGVFRTEEKMLNDEIITKLAEETVQSFGEIDENYKQELLDTAKKAIEAEYRRRILKDLNRVAISKLDSYLTYDLANSIYTNSVVEFLKTHPSIENESVGEVYLHYSVFCRENCLQAMSKIAFSKEIQKQADMASFTTTINGRSIRVFKRR